MKTADIVREYGPFPGVEGVHGVSWDGSRVWFASGNKLNALDPDTGQVTRSIDVAAHAGTAFDGLHLYQIAEARIQKIDPRTGAVLGSIPAPGGGGDSGLTWAEGLLWVGQYRERKIHQVDPETGKVLRTIESDRFVTGVTWVEGELWHGTWEGEQSELRRVDPATGEVREKMVMPAGTNVAGMEAGGPDVFYCGGGGKTSKVRAVRRPRQVTRGFEMAKAKKKAVKAAPEKPQAQRLLEAARKAQGELRDSRFSKETGKRAVATIGRKPIKLGGGD